MRKSYFKIAGFQISRSRKTRSPVHCGINFHWKISWAIPQCTRVCVLLEREIRKPAILKKLILILGVVFWTFWCVHRLLREILSWKLIVSTLNSDLVYWPISFPPIENRLDVHSRSFLIPINSFTSTRVSKKGSELWYLKNNLLKKDKRKVIATFHCCFIIVELF